MRIHLNDFLIGGNAGGGKGGGGGGATGLDDTLRSASKIATHWILSHGEIGGWLPSVDPLKYIYLDGTPIRSSTGEDNFKGVYFAWRSGTPTQSSIAGTALTGNTIDVSQKVIVSTPAIRTINGSFAAVRVSILTPSLATIDDSGNRKDASVNFAIDISINGAPYVERVNDTISGRTSGGYVRDYTISVVNAAAYSVRVRRITADSNSLKLANDLYWQQYTPLTDRDLAYPNTATIYLRLDALYFRQIPRISVRLPEGLLILVPSNYTPSTGVYAGTWDGTFIRRATSNPAWIVYNSLLNIQWGLGNYLKPEHIDKWAFYRFSQVCDQPVSDGWGGQERRHTWKGKIGGEKQENNAFNSLKQMLASFRAQLNSVGGKISVAFEEQTPLIVGLYSESNAKETYDEQGRCIEHAFNYSHASLQTRHTVILVSWRNPDRQGTTETETVYCSEIGQATALQRYGYRPLQVDLPGCTSRGEAHRYGRWLLATEYLEGRIVTFATSFEGKILAPGAYIKIADNHRKQQQLAGRIVSATTTQIVLDRPIQIPPSTGSGATLSNPSLSIIANGIETQIPILNTGTTNTLAVSIAQVPAAETPWQIANAGEIYQILSVGQAGEDGLYPISAAAKSSTKWSIVDNIGLFDADISGFVGVPEPPTNIEIHTTLNSYVVGWKSSISKQVIAYELEQSLVGSNVWNPVPLNPGMTDVEITASQIQPIVFRVAAIAIDNKRSTWLYSPSQFATTGRTLGSTESGAAILDKYVFLAAGQNYQLTTTWSDNITYTHPVVFTGNSVTNIVLTNPSGLATNATISTDVPDLTSLNLLDKISYVRVAGTGSVTLYEGLNYTGASQVMTIAASRNNDGRFRADSNDFTIANDKAKSIKLSGGSTAFVSQHEPGRNPTTGSVWTLTKL